MAGKCCTEMKTLEGNIAKGQTKHAANNEIAGAGSNAGGGKGKGGKGGKGKGKKKRDK